MKMTNRYGPYDEHILRRTIELRRQAGFPTDRIFSTARPNLQAGRVRAAITDRDALAKLETEVRQHVEICREFGYQDIYFYGIDEAKGQLLHDQLPSWEVVRRAGGQIFAAAHEDAVDAVGGLIKVANRSYRPSAEEAEKWHDVGSLVYAYGNPQSGVSEPATYRRNFGHAWNDFDSIQYRGHKFVLPTVDGVIGTLQWEDFREAIDNDPPGHTVPMLYLDTDIMDAWKEQLDPQTADLDQVRDSIVEWILQLQD